MSEHLRLINIEVLINLMKKYPILWDTTHCNFSNQELKRQTWEEIYQYFYKDYDTLSASNQAYVVHDIRRKWKSLRDCYTRELTRRVNPAIYNKARRPYLYFNQLSFLKPHIKSPAAKEAIKNLEDNGSSSSGAAHTSTTVSIKKDTSNLQDSTGYRNENKISLFRVPKDKIIEWQNIIPSQDRTSLSKITLICEQNFPPEFIVRQIKTDVYSYALHQSKLTPDAIPTLFPNCAKYLSKNIKKRQAKIKTKIDKEITGAAITACVCNPDDINDIFKSSSTSFTRVPCNGVPFYSKNKNLREQKVQQTDCVNEELANSDITCKCDALKQEHIISDASQDSMDFNSYFNQDDTARSWDGVDVKQTFIQDPDCLDQSTSEKTNESVAQDPLSSDIAPSYPSQSLLTEDADKHFLLSLLPHLSCMTPSEKLNFQIKTLNVINEIMNARERQSS